MNCQEAGRAIGADQNSDTDVDHRSNAHGARRSYEGGRRTAEWTGLFSPSCLTLRKVQCPAMDFLGGEDQTDHRKTWRNSQQRDLWGPQDRITKLCSNGPGAAGPRKEAERQGIPSFIAGLIWLQPQPGWTMTAEVCLSKGKWDGSSMGQGGESAECVSGGKSENPPWDGKGVDSEKTIRRAEGGPWRSLANVGNCRANLHPGKSDIMGVTGGKPSLCGAVTLKGEGGGSLGAVERAEAFFLESGRMGRPICRREVCMCVGMCVCACVCVRACMMGRPLPQSLRQDWGFEGTPVKQGGSIH